MHRNLPYVFLSAVLGNLQLFAYSDTLPDCRQGRAPDVSSWGIVLKCFPEPIWFKNKEEEDENQRKLAVITNAGSSPYGRRTATRRGCTGGRKQRPWRRRCGRETRDHCRIHMAGKEPPQRESVKRRAWQTVWQQGDEREL